MFTGGYFMYPLFYVSALALKTFPKYRQSPELKKSAETTLSIKASILGGAVTISKENLINEEIRDKEVRVIDSDGSMLGVMPIEQAMDLANERKLDLVNISPNAKPAVCKILDYGKYRYELQKKEKEAKKKQKTTQVKEIRLSTFIEEHDIQVKAKTASKFLADGDKVKVGLRFRGRERDYAAKGMDVMNAFAEAVSDVGVIEKKPVFEGRSLTMVLGPKNDK
jgi:translation initiation factor IF-3